MIRRQRYDENRNQYNTKNPEEAINNYMKCLVIEDLKEKRFKNPEKFKNQKQDISIQEM